MYNKSKYVKIFINKEVNFQNSYLDDGFIIRSDII